MYSLGQIYVGQVIPILIKVAPGPTIYPRVKILRPDMQVDLVSLTPYVDGNSSIIDATIYTGEYIIPMVGPYTFHVNIYSEDLFLTDITESRLVKGGLGSFVGINNVWDEFMVNHQIIGSSGDYLRKILDYLFLYENLGDGSCPVEISVKNGQGVAFRVTDINGNNLYSRGVLNSFGKASIYLDKGNYRVEFYPPCGKTMEKSYEIISVDCPNGNSTATC